MNFIQKIWNSISQAVYDNLIVDNMYWYIIDGLKNTVFIAVFATILGIIIGFIVAIIKVAAAKDRRLRPIEILADIYLTVIRGTPVVVQLMITYYIIFAKVKDPVPVAILAFAINSGAYVAEIVRAGILAVDKGQTEAGRSLGLTSRMTMIRIIMPQAIKNVLPSLGNELITLLKETSVVGFLGAQDLTKGGAIIRSITYSPFVPILTVAAIYLVIVVAMTKALSVFERRLRESDMR